MQTLLRLLNVWEEGRLPNLFYKASITLSKPDKDIQENYRPLSLMNTDVKILNKILENQIQQHIKIIIHHEKNEIYPWAERMVQYTRINKCDTPH